ncbi:putative enzyme [Rubidibacter lacunae KORDI 51-2]|uniref:Putative enzyme n=1 Tax=Rubidibacter lacunae KORDI 51-2 TaxID=582515 RepID=U5DFY3_9CHRO|nr:VOC family protein [Rubidibacter lacunae]ERN40167.1 putative enzyme [Rubidibacter lacunae KORDI 51-2]
MGIRERYEHGVFCWVDLATSDPDAAKPFYNQLFGWEFQDIPVENAPPYAMAFKGERRVAALFLMPEEMKDQNVSPHWQSYINVEDLDAALQRWQSEGGTVLVPACTILDSGRKAVVRDPTGAVVHLWQAQEHIGAGVVNEVNTYCWPELQTRDVKRAARFYQSVFNWEIEAEETPPYYIGAKVKGHYNCGMFDLEQANLPGEISSYWAVYFNVENLDTALDCLKNLGGTVLMEPMTIEQGRFATVADPQGAVFTLIEPTEVDD